MGESVWTFLGRYPTEVIAACALGLTLYQAVISRWHNMLSVRPHLTAFTNRHRAANGGILAYRLMNNGLGPAFIRSFQVFLDGKPVADPEGALRDALGELSYNHTITTLGDDYAMPAGEVRDLLVVTFPLREGETLQTVAQKLDRLDLIVQYASAYRKKGVLDTRPKPATRKWLPWLRRRVTS